MDKKVAGLISALTALSAATPSQAAVQVRAYADLLKPIPNAEAELKAWDAEARARPAQFVIIERDRHHHHHHHHHHHDRRDD
jgi:hypothetical protein